MPPRVPGYTLAEVLRAFHTDGRTINEGSKHTQARKGNRMVPIPRHRGRDINQANVNRRDANEETPLHWAARWQHDAAVARLLIQAGSRRDAFSFNGQSPYELATVQQSYFADLLAI